MRRGRKSSQSSRHSVLSSSYVRVLSCSSTTTSYKSVYILPDNFSLSNNTIFLSSEYVLRLPFPVLYTQPSLWHLTKLAIDFPGQSRVDIYVAFSMLCAYVMSWGGSKPEGPVTSRN